ncbi:hypothetical protein D3C71_2237420 [compost metagenome]
MIVSQATHFFVFNLALPADRKKMVDVSGASEFFDRPGGHDFWYWSDGMENAVKARLIIGKGVA